MRPIRLLASVSAAIAMAAPALVAVPMIEVFPAQMPNALGSPNFAQAQVNAINTIYNSQYGVTSTGTPGTPAYHEAITGTVPYSTAFVTSFNSWNGVANPGGDFAGEYGSRIHYGAKIDGGGEMFSLSQTSFSFDSDDPWNALDYTFSSYSEGYMGVLYGGDGLWGGGDDSFITSGSSSQLVNGIVTRGPGQAFWPGGGPVASGLEQSVIDQLIADLEAVGPVNVTGTWNLATSTGTYTGSATVTLGSTQSVPDGGTTLGLLSLPLIGLVWMSRRQKRVVPAAAPA